MGTMIIRPLDSDVLGAAEMKVITAKILSIDIIDDKDQPITSDIVQYVNLKKDEKYVDGVIVKNLYQLGNVLRAKVTFDKPGQHHFTLKLIADENNVNYSESEKGQPYAKYQENILDFITESDGTKIIEGENELFLNQSGDSLYSLLAKDDLGGKALIKPSLLTKRLVYFMEVKMKGISSPDMTDVFKVYKELGIMFQKVESIEIEHTSNIGTDAEDDKLKRELTNIYNKSIDKEKYYPYCVVIAYVNQLAVKASNQKLAPYPIIQGGPDKITIPICESESKDKKHQLWLKITEDEDWFVDCLFIENGNGKKMNIPIEKCTPIHTINAPSNYCEAVEIDVSHLSTMSGEILLTVNYVDYFRGGITFLDNNIIVIAAQCNWKKTDLKEQTRALIHELGHKIGMVPKSVPNYYTGSGHKGPHCHAGLKKQLDYRDIKGSTCVMFGETNMKMHFCTDCANAVKKADLSLGVFPVKK